MYHEFIVKIYLENFDLHEQTLTVKELLFNLLLLNGVHFTQFYILYCKIPIITLYALFTCLLLIQTARLLL